MEYIKGSKVGYGNCKNANRLVKYNNFHRFTFQKEIFTRCKKQNCLTYFKMVIFS